MRGPAPDGRSRKPSLFQLLGWNRACVIRHRYCNPSTIQREFPLLIETAPLPPLLRELLRGLADEVRRLNAQSAALETTLQRVCQDNDAAHRLLEIPGTHVGAEEGGTTAATASAVVSAGVTLCYECHRPKLATARPSPPARA
jgi:hypothetical protein